ncbi:hypothetical protein LguiB_018743 [Lonicera macranthoides]
MSLLHQRFSDPSSSLHSPSVPPLLHKTSHLLHKIRSSLVCFSINPLQNSIVYASVCLSQNHSPFAVPLYVYS